MWNWLGKKLGLIDASSVDPNYNPEGAIQVPFAAGQQTPAAIAAYKKKGKLKQQGLQSFIDKLKAQEGKIGASLGREQHLARGKANWLQSHLKETGMGIRDIDQQAAQNLSLAASAQPFTGGGGMYSAGRSAALENAFKKKAYRAAQGTKKTAGEADWMDKLDAAKMMTSDLEGEKAGISLEQAAFTKDAMEDIPAQKAAYREQIKQILSDHSNLGEDNAIGAANAIYDLAANEGNPELSQWLWRKATMIQDGADFGDAYGTGHDVDLS